MKLMLSPEEIAANFHHEDENTTNQKIAKTGSVHEQQCLMNHEEEEKEADERISNLLGSGVNTTQAALNEGSAMMLAADPGLGKSTIEMAVVPNMQSEAADTPEITTASAMFTRGQDDIFDTQAEFYETTPHWN